MTLTRQSTDERFGWQSGDLVVHRGSEVIPLTRVVVPPYLRVRDGHIESVSGYVYQRRGGRIVPVATRWAKVQGQGNAMSDPLVDYEGPQKVTLDDQGTVVVARNAEGAAIELFRDMDEARAFAKEHQWTVAGVRVAPKIEVPVRSIEQGAPQVWDYAGKYPGEALKKSFVARVLGKDPRYKVAREFIPGAIRKGAPKVLSNAYGTRTLQVIEARVPTDEDGVYEVRLHKSGNRPNTGSNSTRYYRVDGGQIIEMPLDEFYDWLDAHVLMQRLRVGVQAAVASHRSIKGTVSGHGMFTKGDDGVPAWVAVDAPGLTALREDVVKAMASLGVPARTDHGFAPHVTVAYLDPGEPHPRPISEPIPLTFDRVIVEVGPDATEVPLA